MDLELMPEGTVIYEVTLTKYSKKKDGLEIIHAIIVPKTKDLNIVAEMLNTDEEILKATIEVYEEDKDFI